MLAAQADGRVVVTVEGLAEQGVTERAVQDAFVRHDAFQCGYFIENPDDEAAYLPDLEAVGYEVRVREPGHHCLCAGEPDAPVNLHC